MSAEFRRGVIKFLAYFGTYFYLVMMCTVLKVPQQVTAYMVLGYLSALVSWRLIDGK
jgi:hypothetical protein